MDVQMKFFLAVSLFALSACTTGRLIEKRYNPKRGGVATYTNSGRTEASRKQAFSLMGEYCSGEYVINSESAKTENAGFTMIGNSAVPTSQESLRIDFDCK